MDTRAYVESHAREFIDDLKQWLAIPSVSADPARHGARVGPAVARPLSAFRSARVGPAVARPLR